MRAERVGGCSPRLRAAGMGPEGYYGVIGGDGTGKQEPRWTGRRRRGRGRWGRGYYGVIAEGASRGGGGIPSPCCAGAPTRRTAVFVAPGQRSTPARGRCGRAGRSSRGPAGYYGVIEEGRRGPGERKALGGPVGGCGGWPYGGRWDRGLLRRNSRLRFGWGRDRCLRGCAGVRRGFSAGAGGGRLRGRYYGVIADGAGRASGVGARPRVDDRWRTVRRIRVRST